MMFRSRSYSHSRHCCEARRLADFPLHGLAALLMPFVCLAALFPSARHRLYDGEKTFLLFLRQALSPSMSCRAALSPLHAGRAEAGLPPASFRTAAYCCARKRLGEAQLRDCSRRLAEAIPSVVRKDWLFLGHPVKSVDGSSLTMPDTAENQAAWPQPARQKTGCGFPVMRVVAIFSLATGALLEMASDTLQVNERMLFRRLWEALLAGEIVLADRGFCGFAEFAELSARGVHCVMRRVQRLKEGGSLRRIESHSKNDVLSEWKKPKLPTGHLAAEVWAQLPAAIRVRQVRLSIARKGFRTTEIYILTTLLDAKKYPAGALAALYRRRWEAEGCLRNFKCTMGADPLRCKSPAMIRKELMIKTIAYNLVCLTIAQAAARVGCKPGALGFSAALGAILQRCGLFVRLHSKTARKKALTALLDEIGRHKVRPRPGRREPRALKRMQKNYQLLTKPRHDYVKILHRTKYKIKAG